MFIVISEVIKETLSIGLILLIAITVLLLLAVIIGVLLALLQRFRQIEGGVEDAAAKY